MRAIYRSVNITSLGRRFVACLFLALVWSEAAQGLSVDNKMLADEADGTNWPSYGRTFSENHFSPLKEINPSSVSKLGLKWFLDLDVTNSITAPLEADGVIYVAAGYSIVHAIDASSGKLLWRYDPGVPQASGKKLRVGWGIRGLALWKDAVYVGTQDGRLIALDAKKGRLRWSVQTLDKANGAFISGPPRAFNGKIVIGNAGGDFSPLRGYVTAYDADNGKEIWRFFVVPGEPGKKDGVASDDVMQMAAKTWTGHWWTYGGGGTVWNSLTYDPDMNRIYLGTGNGSPMNWKIRSPDGGDNLFVASVVALDADTGRYVWHYQTTPGDAWDYDSSTDMTLATIEVNGESRKVMLHAAKNGFFYVLDRTSGKLISAEKLGTVTWADRVDVKTGRPIEVTGARYQEKGILLWPSFQAVHHWTPQSFSPLTGLVYVPTLEMPSMFSEEGVNRKNWNPTPITADFTGLALGESDVPKDAGHSVLKAWDPRTQKAVWQIDTPGISNGGVLSTGGNLVFQGLADGYLHAYAADSGRDLWKFYAGVSVTGVPLSYRIGSRQYVAITAGPLNGATGAFGSASAQWGWQSRHHKRRLLAFGIGGKTTLPPEEAPTPAIPLAAQDFPLDNNLVTAGAKEYLRCSLCHGPGVVAGGVAPDLRASSIPLSAPAFAAIVRDGGLVERGMPRFAELTDTELDAMRHYIRARARGMTIGPAGTMAH